MDVKLVLFKKNGTKKSFPVPSSVSVIGRRQDCDLCIPLMVISRRHCELNQDQGRLKIRDLKSKNGVFVNEKKIAEAQLNAGDKIKIGPIDFAVQIDGKPADFTSPYEKADIVTPPTAVAEGLGSESQTFAGFDDLNDLDEHHNTEIFKGLEESFHQ